MKKSNYADEMHPEGGSHMQYTLECFGCGRESVHTYAFGHCPYCEESICELSLVASFNEMTGKADPSAVRQILRDQVREA